MRGISDNFLIYVNDRTEFLGLVCLDWRRDLVIGAGKGGFQLQVGVDQQVRAEMDL